MKISKILTWMTIAFVLMSAYVFVYKFLDHNFHQPFPFFQIENEDGGIRWDGYYDYFFTRITIFILVCIITYLVPKYREYFFTFLVLWLGYLLDYGLIFNQPLRWYNVPLNGLHFSIPLSYSLFAGLSMVFITYIAWKRKL